LTGTLEKTITIAGEIKNKVSENEYGKKIIDIGDTTVDLLKTTTYTIVEKSTEVVSSTKELVVNRGSQLKDVIINKSTEVKEIMVNKGSEYKDIVITKSSEVKELVINKGTEVAVYIK
jgi:hypothetical protein